jgi:hypothetical protein
MNRTPAKIGETRVLSRPAFGWQRFYTLIEKRENGECAIECSGSSNEYVPVGPLMVRGIRTGLNTRAFIEYQNQVPVPYKPKIIIKRIEEFEALIPMNN